MDKLLKEAKLGQQWDIMSLVQRNPLCQDEKLSVLKRRSCGNGESTRRNALSQKLLNLLRPEMIPPRFTWKSYVSIQKLWPTRLRLTNSTMTVMTKSQSMSTTQVSGAQQTRMLRCTIGGLCDDASHSNQCSGINETYIEIVEVYQ